MRVCHACVLLWSAQVQCCWTYPGQGTLRITGNMSDATKVPPCIHRHPASFSAAYSSTQGSWFILRVTGGGASSRRPRREEHRCHSTAAGHACGRQGRALPEEVRPRGALSTAQPSLFSRNHILDMLLAGSTRTCTSIWSMGGRQ